MIIRQAGLRIFWLVFLVAGSAESAGAVLNSAELMKSVETARAGDENARAVLKTELMYYELLESTSRIIPEVMNSADRHNARLIREVLGLVPGTPAPSQQVQEVPPREDCIPPSFYTSLPRDRDWYYGTAADPDTDEARDLALRNLGKQVTGDVRGWTDADIQRLAGAGQNRTMVALNVGKLLPQSTLLAGWEQDDFERCNGRSYVLVRIEKEKVRKFIGGDAGFRSDLVQRLSKRVDKVDEDVASLRETVAVLVNRITKVEATLTAQPATPANTRAREDIKNRVASIKSDISSGRPVREVEKKLSIAERDLQKMAQTAEHFKDVYSQRDKEALERINKNLDSGTITRKDFVDRKNIFLVHIMEEQSRREYLDFLDKALYAKPDALDSTPLDSTKPQPPRYTREEALMLGMAVANGLENAARRYKYTEEYLRRYPDGMWASGAVQWMEQSVEALKKK